MSDHTVQTRVAWADDNTQFVENDHRSEVSERWIGKPLFSIHCPFLSPSSGIIEKILKQIQERITGLSAAE